MPTHRDESCKRFLGHTNLLGMSIGYMDVGMCIFVRAQHHFDRGRFPMVRR